MKFSIKVGNPEKQRSDCIVVGIFEPNSLSKRSEQFNKISNGYISTLLNREGITGKIGQKLLLYHVPNLLSERILLVGCGKECDLDEYQYKQIIQETIDALSKTRSAESIFLLTELNVRDRNIYWKIRQTVEKIEEMFYNFDQFKSDKNQLFYSLDKIIFSVRSSHDLLIGESAIRHGLSISNGIRIAKDLGNMPPNICNASYIANQASQLANTFSENIVTRVINEQEMRHLGMNAYLSVGSGSRNESLMSVIEYKGNPQKNVQPIVLVGKGMTFDSGGLSIKPAESMDEMKYDMCGAAAVYGVMNTVAELRLPLNIIGVLAACENMPGGCSYRPGDILTTMSGQTIEILNTDAEGRIVLCDVLTYVERFKPESVIDIATLTGACVIALGKHVTGLMSNNDLLSHELIIASKQSGDHAWRLPLSDEFQKQIESRFADIANVGGRSGGAITAGCFLSRFTKKYRWAHLDIAGTAWVSSENTKGATGRPVAMLSHFLLNRAGLTNNGR